MTRALPRWAAWLALATLPALSALPALAPAQPADETRAQTEQRLRLAAQLLADSPTAQRIVASGDSAAVAHLNEGRLHHSIAEDAFKRGDFAAARRSADEALRHLGHARRMVPDQPARQAALRTRHEQVQANLERLLESWRQRVPPSEVEDGDRMAAMGLLATARGFGQQGRYEESLHVMASAEKHLLVGMARTLQTRELDYTVRPGTPAEELQLELARHQGLAELLPLALAELRPRPDAAALATRYADTARTLREQAVQQRDAGNVTQALAHVRSATLYVQRALAAAGVVAPPAEGERP